MSTEQVDLFAGAEDMLRGRLMTTAAIKRFVLAGRAYVTIRSTQTGVRFTYCVATARDPYTLRAKLGVLYPPNGMRFVSVLTGPDNTRQYSYIGFIPPTKQVFMYGKAKSRIGENALSVNAFRWFWNAVIMQGRDDLMGQLEVWHEGRCGRCGRRLTVPDSIESGFGPDCIGIVMGEGK